MAVFSAILSPAQGGASTDNANKVTLGATTSSAEIAVGHNSIIGVCSLGGPFFIRFGPSGLSAASVNDIPIPQNQIVTFDMGREFDSIRLFNNTAGSIDIYWFPLSKQ